MEVRCNLRVLMMVMIDRLALCGLDNNFEEKKIMIS